MGIFHILILLLHAAAFTRNKLRIHWMTVTSFCLQNYGRHFGGIL